MHDSKILQKKDTNLKYLLTSLMTTGVLIASHLYAEWPHYVKLSTNERNRIANINNDGAYLDDYYTSILKRNRDIKSVLEIGSRDGKDALKLSEYYQCHVFAFECNPLALPECLNNIAKNPNVTLVPYAAWDTTRVIDFFPIIETQGIDYNPGASSCFPVSKNGHHKNYVQTKTQVQALRLDEWLSYSNISQVDLVCIDAQGATMNILKGFGTHLAGVKYIIVELAHKTIYDGETLKDAIDQFLESNGFRMYVGKMNRFFGDYLYVRKDIIAGWWGPDNV